MGYIIFSFGLLMLLAVTSTNASWGSPGSGQYHIQTDEGPERYFRYQTDNGQYRKEKRLQDGTVIGTDAWIDALGYLRQKDYIADGQGYRILKSKTVFVGAGQPIEEAIRSIKKLPPQAGTIISADLAGHNKLKLLHSTTTTTTRTPTRTSVHTSTTTPAPLYYDHPSTPSVYIRPNSQPLDNSYVSGYYKPAATQIPTSTPAPFYSTYDSYQNIPSTTYEPPFSNTFAPIAVYPPSTTPSPISGDFGPTPIPISSTSLPITSTSLPEPYPTGDSALNPDLLPPYISSTPIPNDLSNYDPYLQGIPTSTFRPTPITSTEALAPLNGNNLDVQPLFSRTAIANRPYSPYDNLRSPSYNNNLGNGYDPQFPQYDGVSVNNNGFRYYLPRQYHEEDNIDSERRAGSFGYIDPFGIRRVIYYNASPEGGFVHRKNNRYVGFNATPYDPRPL